MLSRITARLSKIRGAVLGLAAAGLLGATTTRADLNSATYWFGNTWGGGSDGVHHMRMDLSDLWVRSDGSIVTTADWEELRGTVKMFKEVNGQPIRLGESPSNTHPPTGGYAVTGDDNYAYAIAQRKYKKSDGIEYFAQYIARYNWDGSVAGFSGAEWQSHCKLVYETPTSGGVDGPWGMVIYEGKLYLSDPFAKRTSTKTKQIKVFRTSDMARLSGEDFDLNTSGTGGNDVPRRLTADNQGYLWISQQDKNGAWRVRKYGRSGTYYGREITSGINKGVGDIEFAMIGGLPKLFVADCGPTQAIRRYTDVNNPNGNPSQDWQLGVNGGVLNTSTGPKGSLGPARFFAPTGVGVDGSGNIYVGTGSAANRWMARPIDWGCGAIVSKYNGSKQHQWSIEGLAFIDSASADPGDDTRVYTRFREYVLDYSKATADSAFHPSWTNVAMTIDWVTYPNDPRLGLYMSGQGALMRRINGQKFMVIQPRQDDGMAIYRFDGHIAVPAALFMRQDPGGSWPPNRPSSVDGKSWLWVDGDGDGQFDSNEFEPSGVDGYNQRCWAQTVDDYGNIWIGEEKSKIIHKFPVGSFVNGVPQWSASTKQTWTGPSTLSHLRRIEPVAHLDNVYLSGFISGTYQSDWKSMGNVVYRYNSWSTRGAGSPTWTLTQPALPYQKGDESTRHLDFRPNNIVVEGDYVFIGYDLNSQEPLSGNPDFRVYRASNGSYVGLMQPGPEVGYRSGAMDGSYTMTAHKRADGTYVVFYQNHVSGSIQYFQWKP